MRRPSSILRSTSFLLVGTLALIVFIAVTGDSRRRSNAIHRTNRLVDELSNRVGESRLLPLNLSPHAAGSSEEKIVGMEWLSSADAYFLRAHKDSVMVAWTRPIVQALGRDGRAVIFFEQGKFSIRWLTLAEFEDAARRQASLIQDLRNPGSTEDS